MRREIYKGTALSLLLALTSGCRASNPTVPHRTASEAAAFMEPASAPSLEADSVQGEPKTVEPVIARIGGEEVFVSELLSSWMLADSLGLRDMLENLVTSKLVAREAKLLEITVSEKLIGAEYAATLTEMETGLQREQPGMRLDEWIAGSLGIDPARYRLGIRQDVGRRLLAERVVRNFTYSSEWAEARVLVVETPQEADAALIRLQSGEPFARVAGEISIDPTGKDGGRIPPIPRNESTISRLIYSTKVGEFGGPVLEGERWLILQPDEFHAALEGDWTANREAIEGSLDVRPVTEPEYWLWKVEMSEKSPADFKPFFELIGEPTD
ncbi:MAG: hypothetical protein ACI8X5_000046 [Planctomycetota bacterium]|jgi:hypothetical protein